MFDESAPLFVRIADELADDIATGVLAEGDRVPSGNELAAFHGINPATAAKGINLLVERGLVEKRRGVGMFVTAGARNLLLAERRAEFVERYVAPLVTEAQRLGIDAVELARLVTAQAADDGGPGAGEGDAAEQRPDEGNPS